MGFYYVNPLSIVPLGVAYGVLALVYLGVLHATRHAPARKPILIATGIAFLVLPIGEELWVAWNFRTKCTDAGTFIYKKVHAEGFFDSTRTTHAGPPTREASRSFDELGYRFLEMKGQTKYVRIERGNGEWKSSIIDRPSARYHYTSITHAPETHKVVRHEYTVLDSTTHEVLARELQYGRSAPWFFVGLSAPIKICTGSRSAKGLLYENVLIPPEEKGTRR